MCISLMLFLEKGYILYFKIFLIKSVSYFKSYFNCTIEHIILSFT